MGVEEKTILDLVLGDMTSHEWVFNIALMFIGISLYVLKRIKNRKDKSFKPSIKYYFTNYDNIIAIIYSILLTYILIRFYSNYQEQLIDQLPKQWRVTPYFAMVILGFFQHKISEFITKKSK